MKRKEKQESMVSESSSNSSVTAFQRRVWTPWPEQLKTFLLNPSSAYYRLMETLLDQSPLTPSFLLYRTDDPNPQDDFVAGETVSSPLKDD